MEWDKIENDWKKQLDNREIIPSDAAWQKLAQQLGQEEKKVKKLAYKKWLSLAACLLVGGAIGWMLLPSISNSIENQLINPIEENIVVEVEEMIQNPIQNDVVQEESKSNNQVVVQGKEQVVLKNTQQEESRIVDVNVLKDISIEKASQDKELATSKLIPITIDKRDTTNRIVVDSNKLLKQVEGEVEMEYRETKLKKIFETTKKVVVDISNSKYEK